METFLNLLRLRGARNVRGDHFSYLATRQAVGLPPSDRVQLTTTPENCAELRDSAALIGAVVCRGSLSLAPKCSSTRCCATSPTRFGACRDSPTAPESETRACRPRRRPSRPCPTPRRHPQMPCRRVVHTQRDQGTKVQALSRTASQVKAADKAWCENGPSGEGEKGDKTVSRCPLSLPRKLGIAINF